MSFMFQEIDFQSTPLGDISLRRRAEPRLDGLILYEVKLNDEFLMSSLFTEAEIQLSHLGLKDLAEQFNQGLDVIVGGLGLGHTALAALENPAINSLKVVEVMAPVISWHQQGMVPRGNELATDPRCELILADFFEVATNPAFGFSGQTLQAGEQEMVHAILLDIDHTPSYWLNPQNSTFYSPQSLTAMASKIHPGGVFALWSDELPDAEFIARLETVFDCVESHIIRFPNPYTRSESTNSVYVARKN